MKKFLPVGLSVIEITMGSWTHDNIMSEFGSYESSYDTLQTWRA